MKRLYPRPDAADYLGMSVRSFDVMAAPYLPYVLVGRTGKRYDARDLDAWVDAQAKISPPGAPCKTLRASPNAVKSGTSTRSSASVAPAPSFVSQLGAARSARRAPSSNDA